MIINYYHCPLLFAKKVSRRVSLGASPVAKLANRSAENPGLEVSTIWSCICVHINKVEGFLFVVQMKKIIFCWNCNCIINFNYILVGKPSEGLYVVGQSICKQVTPGLMNNIRRWLRRWLRRWWDSRDGVNVMIMIVEEKYCDQLYALNLLLFCFPFQAMPVKENLKKQRVPLLIDRCKPFDVASFKVLTSCPKSEVWPCFGSPSFHLGPVFHAH